MGVHTRALTLLRDAGESLVMRFRLFIDHGLRRAVLHADTCASYSELPAGSGPYCMWSDQSFASEEEARKEAFDSLRDGRGPYRLSAHSCVGTKGWLAQKS